MSSENTSPLATNAHHKAASQRERAENIPTVLITGASKGVGAACAHQFAKAYPDGVNLALVARGQAGLDALAAELSLYPHCTVQLIRADIADLAACQSIVTDTVNQFGAINILINNAGLHHRGDFRKRSAIEVAAMVDVNLRSPIVLSSLVLPHMPANKRNAIVMVGSLAGRAPLQGAATYSSTKSGLRAFAYALSDELRDQNINVAVVSPGPIDTSFIMAEIDEVEDIVYSQPMSTPEAVAEAVFRLANGTEIEIAMPWFSGKLTTFGYLFPRFRRASRQLLYKIGRKNKQKYRNRANNQ